MKKLKYHTKEQLFFGTSKIPQQLHTCIEQTEQKINE